MSTSKGSAKFPRRPRLALPLLAFCLLFAANASAYLDPGTGSILLQGMVAATAAVVTWASMTWRSTTAWVRSRLGLENRRDPGH